MDDRKNSEIIFNLDAKTYEESLSSFSSSNNYIVANNIISRRDQLIINRRIKTTQTRMNNIRNEILLNDPYLEQIDNIDEENLERVIDVEARNIFRHNVGVGLELLLSVNRSLHNFGGQNVEYIQETQEILDGINHNIFNCIQQSEDQISLNTLRELADIQVDLITRFSKYNDDLIPLERGGVSTTALIASDVARRVFNEIKAPEIEGVDRLRLDVYNIDLNLLHGPIRGIVNSPDGSAELAKHKRILAELIIIHNIGTIPEPELILDIPKEDLDEVKEKYEEIMKNLKIPENIIESIAEETHEALREMKKALGDDMPAWNDAEQWMRDSTVDMIKSVAINQEGTKEELHNSWLESKKNAGWKYGPEKSSELKTHPFVVPYEDLPYEEKLKDDLIRHSIDTGLYMAREGDFDANEIEEENKAFLDYHAKDLGIDNNTPKGPGD